MKLIWGNNPELKFISNDEYYEGLGQLTNDCCKITYEENSVTGSYSDVYRIAFDCNPHKLILAFQDKLRTGNRINCDEYIRYLVDNGVFDYDSSLKLVFKDYYKVRNWIPTQYRTSFDIGYNSL
ncbi:hypothetical protein [Treponema berlinense]|uniref:hypothetical protein n=1 Tax=Treponema berlinense TaxID=225004 RepID=UPI0023F7BD92|nr:hypothetical protein [Treponema berlinense]